MTAALFGPHSFTVQVQLPSGHPGLTLASGSASIRCAHGCGFMQFLGGKYTDSVFRRDKLVPEGHACEVLCPRHPIQPQAAAALGAARAPPAEAAGAGGAAAAKARERDEAAADPLHFDFRRETDEASLVKMAQACVLRSFSERRLDDLDPFGPITNNDIRIKDIIAGRVTIKARTSATAQGQGLYALVCDCLARRMLRVWGTLADPAARPPAIARGAVDLEIAHRDLCADWAHADGRISIFQMVEASLSDVLFLLSSILDIDHSLIAADLMYHGRATGIYKYVADTAGTLFRTSWLYPRLRESILARESAYIHAVSRSPRIGLVETLNRFPFLHLGLAHVLRDGPTQMAYYTGKHAAIVKLQATAAHLQKPHVPRWHRQQEAEARSRKLPRGAGGGGGRGGRGGRGGGADDEEDDP